jgi:hypothetical protein
VTQKHFKTDAMTCASAPEETHQPVNHQVCNSQLVRMRWVMTESLDQFLVDVHCSVVLACNIHSTIYWCGSYEKALHSSVTSHTRVHSFHKPLCCIFQLPHFCLPQNTVYSDNSLLGCNSMSSDTYLWTFRKTMLPSTSWHESKPVVRKAQLLGVAWLWEWP